MTHNKFSPSSFSCNSNNESSYNNPERISAISGNSFVMVGSERGHIVSNINTTTTSTTTKNDTLMVPTPPQAQPSSKKPPVDINEDTNTHMGIVFIEIPAGRDIVGDLINYARRRRIGMTVLRGYGLVSDVTFLHPPESHASTFPMEGPFYMTSLFGTYCDRVPSQFINDPPCSSFSIYLSGNGAQVYGGIVGGKVIAAGVVWITATLFKTLEYYQTISINGRVAENEEDDPIYADGVINDAGSVAHEHINNNNNNTVVHMPDFDVVDANAAL